MSCSLRERDHEFATFDTGIQNEVQTNYICFQCKGVNLANYFEPSHLGEKVLDTYQSLFTLFC